MVYYGWFITGGLLRVVYYGWFITGGLLLLYACIHADMFLYKNTISSDSGVITTCKYLLKCPSERSNLCSSLLAIDLCTDITTPYRYKVTSIRIVCKKPRFSGKWGWTQLDAGM